MMHVPSHPDMLTEKELESVTTVFRSFESGLRGATIDPSVSSVDMYIQIIQIYLHRLSPELALFISQWSVKSWIV